MQKRLCSIRLHDQVVSHGLTNFVPTGETTKVKVYCDMYTDGGGYTMYAVQNGTRTSRITDPDSCQSLGLQLAIPRTKDHATVT